jgi:hypothetical protein
VRISLWSVGLGIEEGEERGIFDVTCTMLVDPGSESHNTSVLRYRETSWFREGRPCSDRSYYQWLPTRCRANAPTTTSLLCL